MYQPVPLLFCMQHLTYSLETVISVFLPSFTYLLHTCAYIIKSGYAYKQIPMTSTFVSPLSKMVHPSQANICKQSVSSCLKTDLSLFTFLTLPLLPQCTPNKTYKKPDAVMTRAVKELPVKCFFFNI